MMTAEDLIKKNKTHPLLKHIDDQSDVVYNENIMNQIEPHIPLLLSSPNVQAVNVDYSQALMYTSDFYGYLRRFQPSVPYALYWVCTRLSGFKGPHDFGPNRKDIFIISDMSIINNIISNNNVVRESAI